MKRAAFLTVLILFIIFPHNLYDCTILVKVQGNSVMVGNNLDASNYSPKIWFIPATDSQYGRMCFGFDENFKIAEGGMNDQGLYISVNALNKVTGWKADPDLQEWEEWEGWFESGVPDGILAKCATVEDAIDVFKKYNLFTLQKVKFLIADKSGNSVVIEWSKEGLQFLKGSDNHYQVSTNFITSNYKPENVPCYRYKIAMSMFEDNTNAPSVGFFRGILSVTHLEFTTPTVYSNICNLETGDIYLYYFHNYEEVININLNKKLKAGKSKYLVSELFKFKPYVAKVYEDYYRKR